MGRFSDVYNALKYVLDISKRSYNGVISRLSRSHLKDVGSILDENGHGAEAGIALSDLLDGPVDDYDSSGTVGAYEDVVHDMQVGQGKEDLLVYDTADVKQPTEESTMSDFVDDMISKAYDEGDVQNPQEVQPDIVSMMMDGDLDDFRSSLSTNPVLDALVNDMVVMYGLRCIEKKDAREYLGSSSSSDVVEKLLVADYFLEHSDSADKKKFLDYAFHPEFSSFELASYVIMSLRHKISSGISSARKDNDNMYRGMHDVIVTNKIRSLMSVPAARYSGDNTDMDQLKSILIADIVVAEECFSADEDPVERSLGSDAIEDSVIYQSDQLREFLGYQRSSAFQAEFMYLLRATTAEDDEIIERSLNKAAEISPDNPCALKLKRKLYISQGRYKDMSDAMDLEIFHASCEEEKVDIAAEGLKMAYLSKDDGAIKKASRYALEFLPMERIEDIIAQYSESHRCDPSWGE